MKTRIPNVKFDARGLYTELTVSALRLTTDFSGAARKVTPRFKRCRHRRFGIGWPWGCRSCELDWLEESSENYLASAALRTLVALARAGCPRCRLEPPVLDTKAQKGYQYRHRDGLLCLMQAAHEARRQWLEFLRVPSRNIAGELESKAAEIADDVERESAQTPTKEGADNAP